MNAARRTAFAAAAALAAVGLALSVLLVRQHASAHAGIASACDLSELVNCDRVATSRWSVFLGLPVAAWGIFGYGLVLILAGFGVWGRRPHASWPAGLLFAIAAVAGSVDLILAGVSGVLVRALCLYCAGTWLVSLGLLFAAWRACRPEGVGASLRADLRLLGARPWLTAGFAVAAVALVAVAGRLQPRYWEKPPPPTARIAPAPAAAPAIPDGPPTIVEFSDYECPFCAKAHEELKALLAARPDVKVLKRHFPLDSSCNPILKRPMHERACALARAAICAEEQGRFKEMDDALFADQQAKRPLEELAARVGLDAARFRACLVDPETSRRLSGDIATGIQIGLKATPTYVVNGVQYTGVLPPGALPPPASAVR